MGREAGAAGNVSAQMPSPLFSIVIANYNHGRFLEEAIGSVLSQDCHDRELIVVDGGSTDNSVEIIRRHATALQWWCSEPDKGQSDAFNKGFAHAQGRFGCWLNADDIMMPGALSAVRAYVERHPGTEWIGGSTVFCDQDLKVLWCSRCMRLAPRIHAWLPLAAVNGPSSFFLLHNLHKVGGFDVGLKYVMDTDLWRKFINAGIPLRHVKAYLWAFRVHGGSKTSRRFAGRAIPAMSRESAAMLRRHGIENRWRRKAGACVMRAFRLCSAVYLRSYIDTVRYRGKPIRTMPGNWGRIGSAGETARHDNA
jgi:GT2 family glycosyltransferase